LIKRFLVLTLIFLFLISSCAEANTLIIATTTSLQDSGLLDFLIPKFESQYSIKVKTLAVGTGEAIALGKRGDADILLVHNKEMELELLNSGFASKREELFYNYFILVGPSQDPAGARGLDIEEAFRKIATTSGVMFASRGDKSGTFSKEKNLWEKISINPEKASLIYLSTGQGMAETLRIASEKGAYTLTDWGTWVTQRKTLSLEVISRSGDDLENTYSVLLMNGEKLSGLHSKEASLFYSWITSPEALKMIENFGVENFGEPLFYLKKGSES
jgi:tungstate transport system substrate-binding protein